MNVKELKKWLDLYDENLEFAVQYGDYEIFFPNILKKKDDKLVISNQYGITKQVDVLTENFNNVVSSQGLKVTKIG